MNKTTTPKGAPRRRAKRHFWSGWPEGSRQRLFRLAPRGTALVCLSVFIGLRLLVGSVTTQIEESKAQYARVLPLVEEIPTLRAQRGDLAHLPPDKAVWRIIDDLSIEQNLISMRETGLGEDDVALQTTLTGLPLNTLARFLNDLRDRASLQTRDCALTRNPDDPRLSDAHLVLAR
ncbi:hypothetical protein [Pseudodesulfovibrio aespoeensis]|uniref:hypothetical protein n=1 Tax=Pseudodesulfovibrio aespoeensis TaxID=182210 RepID=UPI0023525C7C|nr:hypothetical protein [Pseudodesulfovibrio aespoeensis]MCG2731581.1 hypothetical protein [Pseudodesulfovibrio aespoeensis]